MFFPHTFFLVFQGLGQLQNLDKSSQTFEIKQRRICCKVIPHSVNMTWRDTDSHRVKPYGQIRLKPHSSHPCLTQTTGFLIYKIDGVIQGSAWRLAHSHRHINTSHDSCYSSDFWASDPTYAFTRFLDYVVLLWLNPTKDSIFP